MMRRPFVHLALLGIGLIGAALQAQSLPTPPAASRGAGSPQELAALVLQRFASGTPEAFDSVYADPAGRAEMHGAVQHKATRRGDLGKVVWTAPHRAVLLLTGTILAQSSADQANLTRDFSGFYEAIESNGAWTLARKLPFDSANFIRTQSVHVALTPGRDIHVTDTLGIAVGSPYGFATRLNGRAQIIDVQLDGRAAEYAFGGNVLWLRTTPRGNARLVLTYTLEEESRTEPTAAHTAAASATTSIAPAFGEYHNTDGWLPYFSYISANDIGHYDVTVRLPAAYYATTSMPQTESVRDGMRTVHGESGEPDFLVSLMYDRDWHPQSTTVDGVRIETFTTPRFPFSLDSLASSFHRIYRIFSARFGPLPGRYLAIVEDRGAGSGGFKVRMASAIVSGTTARVLSERGPIPSAAFAHEISHAWTMDATGPAANFLREGWATFAESLILADQYGPDVATTQREMARAGYLASGEGQKSILGNPDNGQLHYSKGVWIFAMLEHVLGDSVFDRGIRAYAAHAGGEAGYEQFIDAMSSAAGRDLHALIMPWLSEQYMPDVRARVDGTRVIFTQEQPGAVFDLPLDIELTTSRGPLRWVAHLTHRTDTLYVSELEAVTAVRLDPDHAFLIKRHMGEIVRFEVRAPEAKTVMLLGVSKPTAATRDGDTWVVEMPLAEGRYFWAWQIDGHTFLPNTGSDSTKYGVRIVRGVQPIE